MQGSAQISQSDWVQPARNHATEKPACAQPYHYALVIILLNLLAIMLLFTLRGIDDNRLTSWQWVMTAQRIYLMALLLAGVLTVLWWQMRFYHPRRAGPLWLFIASFGICLSLWQAPEVIVDAARYFTQAKFLSEYGPLAFWQQWGAENTAWTDLPLVPFLYGMMFKLFGESRPVIQTVTGLMFSGTVVLTYFVGKTLWDDRLGWYGGALLLAMPFLLTQTPLMLVDVPSMFFLMMAVYFVLLAVKKDSVPWLILAAFSVSLAVLSKYSTWLMLTALPLTVLALARENRRQAGRRLVLIMLGSGLLLLPFMIWKHAVIGSQLQLLMSYQLPGLQRWQESPFSTYFYQIHPFVTIAMVCSIGFAVHKRDSRFLPVAWMLLLLVIMDVNRSRYALIAFPMLALMAAYAIRQIHNIRLRHFLLLSIITSSLVITLGGYRPFLQKNSAVNLQQAGAYLDGLDIPAVEVIVLPQPRSTINPLVSLPLLDVFTRHRLVYRAIPGQPIPPPAAVVSTSPLRFSWEYRLPRYYTDHPSGPVTTIAVIAGSEGQSMPPEIRERLTGFNPVAKFAQQDNIFRYVTIITVYEMKKTKTARQSTDDLIRG